MAKFSQGLFGAFVGKVGPVVGSTWKGIPYMKAKSAHRTSRKGPNEGLNQNKMADVHAFLQPIINFLRQGFKGYTPTVEGYNAAKSYNLLHAFDGEKYEPKVLNPSKVLVSHGTLPLPENIRVSVIDHQQLKFEWDIPPKDYDRDTDQVMLLAYNPEKNLVDMKLLGQFRSVGSDSLELHKLKEGDSCFVWVAFVAGDRGRQSRSLYLGDFEI
jgi:hypothetical protein